MVEGISLVPLAQFGCRTGPGSHLGIRRSERLWVSSRVREKLMTNRARQIPRRRKQTGPSPSPRPQRMPWISPTPSGAGRVCSVPSPHQSRPDRPATRRPVLASGAEEPAAYRCDHVRQRRACQLLGQGPRDGSPHRWWFSVQDSGTSPPPSAVAVPSAGASGNNERYVIKAGPVWAAHGRAPLAVPPEGVYVAAGTASGKTGHLTYRSPVPGVSPAASTSGVPPPRASSTRWRMVSA